MEQTNLTQNDIDAVWQFMLAAAPQLAQRPELLAKDGFLSSVALHATQARLALKMRHGSEYVPVRKEWRDAATALSETAQQMADRQAALQAAGSLARCAGTPAQTEHQAPAAFAPTEGVE